MKLKNRLWLILALLMVISVNCVFISCSSDDEDDSKKLTSSERQLLGGWSGAGIGMVLQIGGKMYYDKDGSNYRTAETGSWQYNEATGILATTATDKNNNNFQWQITMINEDSWSGLALWNNNKTVSAQRNPETAVRLLLTGITWAHGKSTNVEYEYRTVGSKTRLVDGTDGAIIFFDEISEDIENDVITIYSYGEFFKIYHPYNSKDIYLLYPSGLSLHPDYFFNYN